MFEPGKEYKTRAGYRAVILSDQYHNHEYTLVGAATANGKAWSPASWTYLGRFHGPNQQSDYDLMPHNEVRWVNLYSLDSKVTSAAVSEMRSQTPDCLAVLKIEYPSDGGLPTVEVQEP